MSQIAVQAFRRALPRSHPLFVTGTRTPPRVLPLADSEIATALKAAFATMYGVRRPVAMLSVSEGYHVLCDDGTVWFRRFQTHEWTPGTPIPGTVATGGGVASPLHTKLSQISEVLAGLSHQMHQGEAIDEIKKILGAP